MQTHIKNQGFGFIGLIITLAIIGYLVYMAIDYYSSSLESTAQTIQSVAPSAGEKNNPSQNKPRGTIVQTLKSKINTLETKHLEDMKKSLQ